MFEVALEVALACLATDLRQLSAAGGRGVAVVAEDGPESQHLAFAAQQLDRGP